jgi:deazaflavin-dependent oxidoreductase (nitroreductase family)
VDQEQSPPVTLAARLGARLLRARWLVRAPVWVYRARLGAVLGPRLIMVEHTGRLSGRCRYVVLEVVSSAAGAYVVVAGFGGKAQWLRNVQACPRVRIWSGSRRPVPAAARRMAAPQAAQALQDYASAHPRSWKHLRPVLQETLGARIDATGTSLPVIELLLDGHAGRG